MHGKHASPVRRGTEGKGLYKRYLASRLPYKIHAYEYGKDGATFEPRPEQWKASYALSQRAQAEARLCMLLPTYTFLAARNRLLFTCSA